CAGPTARCGAGSPGPPATTPRSSSSAPPPGTWTLCRRSRSSVRRSPRAWPRCCSPSIPNGSSSAGACPGRARPCWSPCAAPSHGLYADRSCCSTPRRPSMTACLTFGFSSYSSTSNPSTGEMTLFDVIDWVAACEGELLELASLSDDPSSPIPIIASDPAFVDEVRAKAESAGVVLSNLAVGADFFTEEPDEHAQQGARVKSCVDL